MLKFFYAKLGRITISITRTLEISFMQQKIGLKKVQKCKSEKKMQDDADAFYDLNDVRCEARFQQHQKVDCTKKSPHKWYNPNPCCP